jgi:hypothetical protein
VNPPGAWTQVSPIWQAVQGEPLDPQAESLGEMQAGSASQQPVHRPQVEGEQARVASQK